MHQYRTHAVAAYCCPLEIRVSSRLASVPSDAAVFIPHTLSVGGRQLLRMAPIHSLLPVNSTVRFAIQSPRRINSL